MIHTSASWTHRHDPCSDGAIRTKETLERLGLTYDSVVPMRLVLDEMGLSDCLFCFCAVKKSEQEEAHIVIRNYISYLLECAENEFTYRVYDKYRGAIKKRITGHMRPQLMAEGVVYLSSDIRAEPLPEQRYLLDFYRILLSDKPDYLVALHAGIALCSAMQTARGEGAYMQNMLTSRLRQWL